MAGLQCHANKNRNRNYSKNQAKKLGYERRLIDKQPHQDLDLCGNSFARYSEVFHPNLQSFVWRRHVRAHADGHQHGGRKVTETSVVEFCHRNEIILLQCSEISKSILLPEQKLFSQPKLEQELIFCPDRERFQSDILMSHNAQTWKFRHTLLRNEEPFQAQTLQKRQVFRGSCI